MKRPSIGVFLHSLVRVQRWMVLPLHAVRGSATAPYIFYRHSLAVRGVLDGHMRVSFSNFLPFIKSGANHLNPSFRATTRMRRPP